MKVTVIIDNIGQKPFLSEWGFSIYIEYKENKVLLDAGASKLFIENAKRMNISLEDVDYAVLSHAHYDHANGISHFLNINNKAKFYLQSACDENCYTKKWIFHRYIGIPKNVLEKYKDRIEYISGHYSLSEGIYLIPHKMKNSEEIGKKENMYQKKNEKWFPDNFDHEQSLVFDTDKGLIIFSPCSHIGPVNIIHEISEIFPERDIFAMIGGFHLFNKTEAEIRNLAKKIKETKISQIYTGHCTGKRGFRILREELGEKIQQFKSGYVIEF